MARESIGALWLSESSKGVKYLSGQIELDGKKTRVVVFKNDFKKEEKHPDYRVYLSEDQQSDSQVPF